MLRYYLSGLAAAVLAVRAIAGAPSPEQTPEYSPDRELHYVPAKENLEARTWFQNAKFGIFLHWGLYSELGGVGNPGLSEWIMNDSRIPAAKYERLAKFFNPQQFDAEAWVRTFEAAGARYVVITSKHHDGFAMFDSKVSPYNVVAATPFKRDPIKELAAACRRHGIKLFFYYSQLDWHNPDYYPLGHTGQSAGRPQSGNWGRYLDYENAQIRELLTQYGPVGGVWFDGWWDQQNTAMENRWELARTYSLIHSLQPAALIVNNHHVQPFPGEDYQTFERDLPGANGMGFNKASPATLPLEMSETMNGSWGFNLVDDNYKTPELIIRTMVGAAGRNSNFLLNTGPMPNGELQPENVDTLMKIGEWLKINGASIYGTRAGPVSPRPWGVTTQKGNQVFVHILEYEDDRLFLPITKTIARARLLTSGKAIKVERVHGGVELSGVTKHVGIVDEIVELTLK